METVIHKMEESAQDLQELQNQVGLKHTAMMTEREMAADSRDQTLKSTLGPWTHDPSSPSKLLVPESRIRHLEAIEHVLFRLGFWYQTNLVQECMTD